MKIILLSSLLIFSNMAIAEDIGYEVEVIIFEDTSELYKNSENWPSEITSEKDNSNIIEDIELNKTSTPAISDKKEIFEFLDSDKYRLNDQARKLQKNERYNILYHKAWKQPGLDRNSAIALTINTRDIDKPKADDIENKSISYIIGNFTLVMSRYLHVVSDLVLYKPEITSTTSAIYTNGETEPVNTSLEQLNTPAVENHYTLIFERRMRSKEIHYIDHPMGGMIVLATPYKIPKTGTKTDQSAQDYKTL